MKKAVVLLSGGLDSATTAAIAKSEGFELYAISFDYGQRHSRELKSAKAIAQSLGVIDHLVISFDMTKIGGSALTDNNIDVPIGRDFAEIGQGIPVTYVPARNIIFLAFAVSYAERIGARDIFIGISEIDYSGYPDCRREFVNAFEKTANLGTKAGTEDGARFRIHTPLARLSKGQTISKGLELGVDFSLTWSCYLGGQKPCGKCDSCKLRLAGFAQVGMKDPLEYVD